MYKTSLTWMLWLTLAIVTYGYTIAFRCSLTSTACHYSVVFRSACWIIWVHMRGVNLKVSTVSTAYARPQLGWAYPLMRCSEVLWGRNEGDRAMTQANQTTHARKSISYRRLIPKIIFKAHECSKLNILQQTVRIFPKMCTCKSLPLTRFACVHGGKHVANMHVSRGCTDCQHPHAHTHSKCCPDGTLDPRSGRPCQVLKPAESPKSRLLAKSRDFSDFGDSRVWQRIWPKSRFGANPGWTWPNWRVWPGPARWLSGPIGAWLAGPGQTGRFGRTCRKVDFLGSDLPNLDPGAYI